MQKQTALGSVIVTSPKTKTIFPNAETNANRFNTANATKKALRVSINPYFRLEILSIIELF